MNNDWGLPLMETVPSEVRAHNEIEILLGVVVPAPLQLFHPVNLNLLRSPFVKFVGTSILGILLHELSLVLKHLIDGHVVPEEPGHLSLIKITVFPLLLELCSNNFILNAAGDFYFFCGHNLINISISKILFWRFLNNGYILGFGVMGFDHEFLHILYQDFGVLGDETRTLTVFRLSMCKSKLHQTPEKRNPRGLRILYYHLKL